MNRRQAAVNIAKRIHQILVLINDEYFIKKAMRYLDDELFVHNKYYTNIYDINIWRDDTIMNDTYGMLTQLPSWESTFEEEKIYYNPRKDLDKFNQLTYIESTGKYNTVSVDDFKIMNTDEYYFQYSTLYEEDILDIMYIVSYFNSTGIDYAFSIPVHKVQHYEVWINEVIRRNH